jgi:hypothetical protein
VEANGDAVVVPVAEFRTSGFRVVLERSPDGAGLAEVVVRGARAK